MSRDTKHLIRILLIPTFLISAPIALLAVVFAGVLYLVGFEDWPEKLEYPFIRPFDWTIKLWD